MYPALPNPIIIKRILHHLQNRVLVTEKLRVILQVLPSLSGERDDRHVPDEARLDDLLSAGWEGYAGRDGHTHLTEHVVRLGDGVPFELAVLVEAVPHGAAIRVWVKVEAFGDVEARLSFHGERIGTRCFLDGVVEDDTFRLEVSKSLRVACC